MATPLSLAATISVCLAGLPGAALATQEADGTLAEVVVTAQKTAESIDKVPISVSVLSGEELASKGVQGYQDLARAVPNVSFTNFGGAGQSNIEIRGVSSQAGSATTGIYLDEVPINIINIYTAGASEPRFFDIDRVEVLRGPQGTIYGSSSMGGTIHFVSAAPDLAKFGGNVHSEVGATKGGGANYEANGVVNLPLAEGVAALRLGGLYRHDSGWIDRVDAAGSRVDSKINDQDSSVVRATLLWKPSDRLTIQPAVFLQRVSSGGNSLVGAELPLYRSPTLVAEKSRDEYAITSVTVGYDLGPAEITAVGGYFWRQDHRLIDGTFYDSGFLGFLFDTPPDQGGIGIGNGAAFATLPAPSQFYTTVNQVHGELRIASKPSAGDRWSWIAGLYYARNRTDLFDNEFIPGFNAQFQSVFGTTPEALLGSGFPNDLVYFANSAFVNEEKAVFGQVSYQATAKLKLTAGLRSEKANSSLDFDTAGFLSSGTPSSHRETDGTATTPRFALAYQATERTLVYASAAKGFRVGGVNRPMPAALCGTEGPVGYDADSLWSYELGTKTRTRGGLQFSAAVFDIRWSRMQQDVVLSSCGFDYKTNTGDAESKGVELEVRQPVGERFVLGLAGNYTSAKMTAGVADLGVVRGDRVPGVPEWTVAADVEYGQPVAGGRGYARLDGQWTGTSQGVIFHDDVDFNRPGYFVLGGRLGFDAGRYQISLFVNNLLDNKKILQRPNVALVEYGLTLPPRTVGLSGSYSF
jgi:outer membrane receptor protein involved in Fe transport